MRRARSPPSGWAAAYFVQFGRYTLISRLLEGEFLDYRAAIPASASMEVVCKTRDFIESVERVSLLITDRMKKPHPLYI